MTQNQYHKNFISLAVSLLCCLLSLYASEIAEDNTETFKYLSKQNNIPFDEIFIQKNNISYDVKNVFQKIVSEIDFYPKIYVFNNKELEDFFKKYKPQPLSKADHLFINIGFELIKNEFDLSKMIPLAESGHGEAQFQTAMILRYDEAEENKKLAYTFFHKAAAQGHAESIYELSDIYNRMFHELNIDRNIPIAHLLCQEAAYIGLEKAKLEVASAPLDGKFDLPKDYEKAKENLKKLADEGSSMAKERFKYLQGMAQEQYEFLSSM